jgi:excinuclease ABC subunit C
MFDSIDLPVNPGCYIFKNKNKRVIYIGKAKNIRKRVKSYFQKKNLDEKTNNLVKKICSIDFIITDNEIEAFILENNLIKKYQPKYNIDLKDAKNYAYLRITQELFPRLIIARNKKGKGIYYGPFVSAKERDYVLNFLRKTFKLRTCKRFPKKPCLRYHINLCCAPCSGLISEKDYNDKISKIKYILSGKSKNLIKDMKKDMKNYSNRSQYELALNLRNEINSIEYLNEHQNMQRQKKFNEDIINFSIVNGRVYLILFNVYKGTLSNKSEFEFDFNDDFIDEFLIQYYSENPVPKEIIFPVKLNNSIISFLQTKKGSNVKVTIPKRGEKKQLLDLVKKNIDIIFFSNNEKMRSLKRKLNLEKNPEIIECFDISHLSGTSIVGSMVQFRNGKPDKNNYRRFKIRSVEKIDDFASIAEVVNRRYSRLIKECSDMPDLIIIDGGKGQLNSAVKELNKLNLDISIISIAKQFEEIYIPNNMFPLVLSKKDIALKFVQEIRDEAHRFAINYNKLIRKKDMIL